VRQDNALRRLGELAIAAGLFDDDEVAIVRRRLDDEAQAMRLAEGTSVRPDAVAALLTSAGSAPLVQSVRIAEVAKRQGVTLASLFAADGIGGGLPDDVLVTSELELKYAGYFARERDQAAKLRRMGQFVLDDDAPYEEMLSLSFESRQKLAVIRPATLAQAGRIPGVSPTDLQNLVLEIEKWRRRATTAPPRGAGLSTLIGGACAANASRLNFLVASWY
jgi:tRNA uridine 5-carboxymethylaminomethyl modification enzyme